MSDRLKDAALTRLKRLGLEFCTRTKFLASSMAQLGHCISMRHGWYQIYDFFASKNFIPLAFQALPSLTSLTSLLREDKERPSPHRLFGFLLCLPQLEDLHLISGGRFTNECISPQVLSKIKSLRFGTMSQQPFLQSPELSSRLRCGPCT